MRLFRMPLLAFVLLATAVLWSLFLFWSSQLRPAYAAGGSIKVTPDYYLYLPGDTVNFHVAIDPENGELSGDVYLEIFEAGSNPQAEDFDGEPVFETTLEAGASYAEHEEIDYTAETSDFDLGPGGYPVKVSIFQDGEEVASDVTWLAIADEESGVQVDLLMIWSVSTPPQRNADGQFVSTDLLDRSDKDPRDGDSLQQHLDIAQSFPDIKTVYAIEPSLLEQLEDMADGFTLIDGEETKDFSDSSVEADSASRALDSLSSLAASENVEVLSTPYISVQLPLLAREGWNDGDGQYRVGDDILTKSLMLDAEPSGAYAPGLLVTTDSLRYLASTGGEYAVLAGDLRQHVEGDVSDTTVSFRLRDISGERITSFFADDVASEALMGSDPDPSGFFASLINEQQKSEGTRLVIAAAPVPMPGISAEERNKIYEIIEEAGWVNSITLNEAKEKYRPDTEPVTLLYYTDPATNFISQSYYQRLSQVHTFYEDYRAAVDTHEPRLTQLDRLMFTAENEYWAGSNASPEAANMGMVYLDKIETLTRDEFDRLDLDIDTPWLQHTSESSARITITNNATHPFTLSLDIQGDGAELLEEYDHTVRAEPGKTEIDIPYSSSGWAGISAAISSGGTTIAESSAGIRPVTSRVWIVIIVAAAALIAGIAYYIFVARRGAWR